MGVFGGFSGLRVIKEALTGHKGWGALWRNPDPQPAYDIIIVGGGGHGLATAYHLAKTFGQARIAVLEKGWLGSGNIGRNTTIIRSNYLLPGNQPFYEFSMKLWESMEQDLNFNAMVSQRTIINLFHSDGQRDAYRRRGNAMHMTGAGGTLLSQAQLREIAPFLNFDNARFPIKGGLRQERAGTARHDGVAWGYARAADRLGVDIIQNCEVTGFRIENGTIKGVETSRGYIGAGKVGVAVAGSSSRVMEKAGMRLPIESHVLQAFVSEGLKPVIPGVITFGAGHFYVSQSDKGGLVFGGDIDGYNSYAQRGNLPVVEDVIEGGMALMPMLGRARLLRSWGGVMDMSMDGSPIIDRTGVDGLFFNGGWCYGGFKATPASGYVFAHLLATGQPHETATAFRMDRFARGHVIDEKGVGAQPNLH
ncbi:sarcosine oxidase subunit beta family protein [Mesobacterium pallidum]|uniref:sarcosine oxidase subunit beta family protein n=1 Tax=Mesobacterium pallidum TaxID=2872037 RepID=UPI001EE2DDA8|nr:sarcosine oxidase subunit beta family protein [Mesobacterium pallidum]